MSETEQVRKFIQRELPQVQMHGGQADIMVADSETGNVHVAMGGACKGCGLSPMTADAMRHRMVEEIDWVESVTIEFPGGFF